MIKTKPLMQLSLTSVLCHPITTIRASIFRHPIRTIRTILCSSTWSLCWTRASCWCELLEITAASWSIAFVAGLILHGLELLQLGWLWLWVHRWQWFSKDGNYEIDNSVVTKKMMMEMIVLIIQRRIDENEDDDLLTKSSLHSWHQMITIYDIHPEADITN